MAGRGETEGVSGVKAGKDPDDPGYFLGFAGVDGFDDAVRNGRMEYFDDEGVSADQIVSILGPSVGFVKGIHTR